MHARFSIIVRADKAGVGDADWQPERQTSKRRADWNMFVAIISPHVLVSSAL